MIKIKTEKDKIHIEGHTLPDICAAVSSVSTTIINCLIELCDEDDYKYEYSSGDCTIEFEKSSVHAMKFYDILLKELHDISDDYPDCVTFI